MMRGGCGKDRKGCEKDRRRTPPPRRVLLKGGGGLEPKSLCTKNESNQYFFRPKTLQETANAALATHADCHHALGTPP